MGSRQSPKRARLEEHSRDVHRRGPVASSLAGAVLGLVPPRADTSRPRGAGRRPPSLGGRGLGGRERPHRRGVASTSPTRACSASTPHGSPHRAAGPAARCGDPGGVEAEEAGEGEIEASRRRFSRWRPPRGRSARGTPSTPSPRKSRSSRPVRSRARGSAPAATRQAGAASRNGGGSLVESSSGPGDCVRGRHRPSTLAARGGLARAATRQCAARRPPSPACSLGLSAGAASAGLP